MKTRADVAIYAGSAADGETPYCSRGDDPGRSAISYLGFLEAAIGLALLLFSADFMVRGAVGLARRIGMPPLVIGLSIIAVGTSAPELVTTITAALNDAPEIALGNVVGSNLANMLLILGVAAAMRPIACSPRVIARDGTSVLAATALFVGIAMTGIFVLWQGLLLLAGLATYLFFTYRAESAADAESLHKQEADDVAGVPERFHISVLFTVGGLVGTVIGAKLLVDGGVDVAESLGVSKAVIGLTLVALGTSLPELAIVIVASMRGHSDVALGNVLGSNIFNLLGIMGAVTLVSPLPVPPELMMFDIWVLLGITILMLPMMITQGKLTRGEGILLIVLYAVYIAFQIGPVRALVF